MTSKDAPSMVVSVKFKVPLAVSKTDRVELDYEVRRALVSNKAGKVKQTTSFTVEIDGTGTSTGS